MSLEPSPIRTTSDTLETLMHRVSVRDFSPEPIDDALLMAILEAARRTPTSSNTQTYSLVVVRDAEKKRLLAELGGNQKHIEDCAVFVAVCADISHLEQGARMNGQPLAKNLELTMIATIDASLVGQSLALAAESLGLGTVMIGGMRNHPQEVAEVLALPQGVFVVYGVCIGHIAQKPVQKPRLPHGIVVHYDQYQPADDAALAAHDAELAAHYESQGRNAHPAAWTGFNARKFNEPQRPFLRQVLESRGFRFD